MASLNARDLIQNFKNGAIVNYSPTEYAALRRTSIKVLCEERQRGSGPRFIRLGRKIFYPCADALESIGVSA